MEIEPLLCHSEEVIKGGLCDVVLAVFTLVSWNSGGQGGGCLLSSGSQAGVQSRAVDLALPGPGLLPAWRGEGGSSPSGRGCCGGAAGGVAVRAWGTRTGVLVDAQEFFALFWFCLGGGYSINTSP